LPGLLLCDLPRTVIAATSRNLRSKLLILGLSCGKSRRSGTAGDSNNQSFVQTGSKTTAFFQCDWEAGPRALGSALACINLGFFMTSSSAAQMEILADPEALARHVADWLVAAAAQHDRPFAVALSGGSTPRRLYELLASPPHREAFPWARTHWFWGDERFVPHSSSSNYRMVRGDACTRPDAAGQCRVPTEGRRRRGARRARPQVYGASADRPPSVRCPLSSVSRPRRSHRLLFPGTTILKERTRWVGAVIGARPGPQTP
jgi:6-phosphogluconolactonase